MPTSEHPFACVLGSATALPEIRAGRGLSGKRGQLSGVGSVHCRQRPYATTRGECIADLLRVRFLAMWAVRSVLGYSQCCARSPMETDAWGDALPNASG